MGDSPRDIAVGGYAFDEETMRGLVNDWFALADDYNRSRVEADHMSIVDGPGLDFASQYQAGASSKHGQAYLGYLEQHREYCLKQAMLLQKALDDYLVTEHHNAAEIAKSDPGYGSDPQPGI